jgi:carboxymethylenebutenolidase
MTGGDISRKSISYSEITIKNEGKALRSLVFPPADSSVSTGIILIHEEWGITGWVIDIASQISGLGFLVIAPDLMSVLIAGDDTVTGVVNEETIRTKLIDADPEKITSALDASFEYLKSSPLCNGRIAVIGFSWGGTQAFRYLTENEALLAGFIFYGKSPDYVKELARIKSPVYGFYGEYDSGLNSTLASTIRKMERLGKEFQPFIIDGGGHGFMRSGERPGATEDNTKARTAGYNKLLELLQQL